MKCDEILNSLNPEQREAVSTLNGPVLVLAGAGTGKTRVITCRIAYMLSSGIAPESILGLTFTNKAAAEMRERLATLVAPELAEKVTLGTFHSFCIQLLRKHIKHLGYLPNFTVADESDQHGIFKQACGMLGYNSDNFPVGSAMTRIADWKNHLVDPLGARRDSTTDIESRSAAIYESYQEILEQQNMVDFDDMLLLTYQIFRDFPEILQKYRNRFRYLLVDEYQDTNTAQFVLIKMLAEPDCNLCVVGDDDQSIYSWRGADISNILDFPQIFAGAKAIKLEQNYRSTSAILNAANAVLSSAGGRRHSKKLWSALGEGSKPKIITVEDSDREAEFVSGAITRMRSENPGLRFSDFAVLYRSNALSRSFELNFRRNSIPYKVVGGQQFFARREIKDAIAYLTLAVNPRADQSLLRVIGTPPRGFGDTALKALKAERLNGNRSMFEILNDPEFLKKISRPAAAGAADFCTAINHAAELLAASESDFPLAISTCLKESGYLDGLQKIYKDLSDVEKRQENIDEFLNDAAGFHNRFPEETLSDYLEKLRLDESNAEERDDNSDAVILSSIHASKGLEYPVVFLVALEQEIFPHYRAIEENSVDEELRLFYVAITRAKKDLYLINSRRRMNRGVWQPSRPSPFLNRLGESAEQSQVSDVIKPMSKEEAKRRFEAACAALFGNTEEK